MSSQEPAAAAASEAPREEGQSVLEHLRELRARLLRGTIAVVVGMGVGMALVMGPYQFIDTIIRAFAPTNRPYPPLQAVGTAELFTSYMTVALGVGVVIGMPFLVYELIAFISPGLYPREKRFVFMALPFVTLFFAAGLAFGWFITVPVAIRFLIGFGHSELIASQPTISDFLRTVTVLLLMNGVVFELPVVIYVLALLNLVTAQQLARYRRYAIVAVVVVAAIITPTGDPINLMLLAVPMYLLFEFGIILARFVPRKPPR